jgi:nucleotide sugar dehydrogenase
MLDGALLVGFVGQGFVGSSYADDFESRGYKTVRYALEDKYIANKDLIKSADVVFVCVPTPTTNMRFDASIVEQALTLVGKDKIAIIKSTIVPGTTRRLQNSFPDVTIVYSPEFLNAANAAHDSKYPFSNIVGLPSVDLKHHQAAKLVHKLLPEASFCHTCTSEEAELIKYAHNVSGYLQIIAYNLIYDVAQKFGADWSTIQTALEADPMISNWYIRPFDKGGRGAGGQCFIKDFAAFAHLYSAFVGRSEGCDFMTATQKMNIALLTETNKDFDIIEEVYGELFSSNHIRALEPEEK